MKRKFNSNRGMDAIQTTLDGMKLRFPKVRTSDGHMLEWDRETIVKQLLRETKLSGEFYGSSPIGEDTAREIAKEAEKRIKVMGISQLSGALVREIVNQILLEEHHHQEWRNVCTRVGTPVYDAHLIDIGEGFEANENANLQENAETSHKKKADKICKEQYLLLLPPKLADAHLSGDLHIHDLEYFGTRGFCFPADEPVVLNNPGSVIVDRIERIVDSAVFIEEKQGWEVYKPGKPIEIQTEEKFEPIKKIYRRKYSGKILCLKTIGGYQIRVTPDHVIATDKGFKRANELEVGDCLEISKDVQLPDKNEIDILELIKDDSVWYVKQEIDAGDYGYEYEKMSKKLNVPYNTVYYWFRYCSFPLWALRQLNIEIKKDAKLKYTRYARKWIPRFLSFNYNLGLFLGLLISEGHYTKEGKETGITNKNQDILTQFSSIADEIFGMVPVVKNSSTPQAIIRSKTINKLFSDLLDIGCSSEVKQIPGKLYSKREDYLLGLLNGLFSGDGGARIKKDRGAYLSYSTQSPVLQKQVLLLLRALGIDASVAEYEREDREFSDKYVIIGHPSEQKKLMDAGFKMIDAEKNRIFNEMCEMEKAENQYSEERKGIVKSIKSYDYDGYVYDLTIDNERHLFSNADGIVVHNCQDWDLRYFFYYGLMPDGSGTKASVAGPAKKPEVAILHAVKILGSAQTNFAGGQGFFNFLTFIAPYLEGLPYEEIEQLMQMFVYEMTQMQVARGGQLVFSSVQLTPGVPKIWKDKPVVYKGKVWNGEQAPLRTYGEFEREARLAFKALMNVMLQGDYWGKPFNFPKPEIAIEPDFLKEDAEFNKKNPDLLTYEELYDLAFELTAKYGTPYFDNKIPEYRGAGEGVSCYQCCAYSFKTSADDEELQDKMYFRNGKHFSMGGWQVITINCPRAAYRAEGDDDKLLAELKRLMDLAVEVLKEKRRWMEKIVESGRMPFATQRPKDPHSGEKGDVAVYLDELVYIIGVVGINEMVQYHYGKQMQEDKGALRLAIRVMTEMELYAKELSQREDMKISFARTPAETTAQRFAVADLLNKECRDKAMKVVKGDLEKALSQINETRDLPIYYTNGTHVPPNADISLAERIKIEQVFFPIVDGGDIMHIFLGEGYPDPGGIKSLAMKIARNTQTGYYAFTKDMTVCMGCSHVTMGLKEECEKCKSKNLDYISRITGYLQAVSGWNEGKKQELLDRMRYGKDEVK